MDRQSVHHTRLYAATGGMHDSALQCNLVQMNSNGEFAQVHACAQLRHRVAWTDSRSITRACTLL